MKKALIFGLILLLNTCLFAAGKRVAVFNPLGEGLSQDELNWIPSSVRRKLEANLNDYTMYQLIDVQNEEEIKNLQKKAESYTYDQQTSLELGKLVSAELGFFSSITKANERYILSVNVTNLTTGVRLSSVTADSVAEPVALFEGAGSAINKVTVKLCEDLGINLSALDRYVLLKGQESLSDNDQMSMTQEEINKYQKKQAELEKQLKEVSLSAELDAEALKAKLEAEKTLAEQQKLIAQERLERLKLQQQRLFEDQEQQKSRTAQQRRKIEEAAAQAEEKAKLLRKQKIDSLSVDQQLAVIEAKKQAMLDIHNTVLAQEKLIKQNANDDYKAQCEAIDAEPLRNGETDSKGKILPAVEQMRKERKLAIRNEIEAKALEDLKKIQGKTNEQEAALYKDIQNDISRLKIRRTISSMEDPRIIDIGNYAGDTYEWDTTVSLYINDVKIFGQKANIAYKNISGKNPVVPGAGKSDAWNDYLDTVDLYDYMFRRNVPALTLEIDYSIEAMSDYYPSMYKMTLYEFRFIDTVSGKVIQVIQPAKSSYRFTINPVVDISYYKGQAAVSTDTKSEKEEKAPVVEYTEVKTGKEVKKRSKKNAVYDQKNGGGARFNMGVNFGKATDKTVYTSQKEGANLEFYMSIPLSTYFFMQFDFGWFSLPTRFGDYRSASGNVTMATYDMGFNVRLGKVNCYALGGVGLAFEDDFVNAHSREEDSVLVYKAALGLDIPLNEFFCITAESGVLGVNALGSSPTFKIGAAFTLPTLVL